VLVEGRFLEARLVVDGGFLLLGEPRVLAVEGGWDFHLPSCLSAVAVEVLSVVVVFGVEAVLEEVVLVVVVLHLEVEVEVVVAR
jgi:hypothetical protein